MPNLKLLPHGISGQRVALSRLLHHDGMSAATEMVLERTPVPHALVANVALQQRRIQLIVTRLRRLLLLRVSLPFLSAFFSLHGSFVALGFHFCCAVVDFVV